jgi:hypothetical protein
MLIFEPPEFLLRLGVGITHVGGFRRIGAGSGEQSRQPNDINKGDSITLTPLATRLRASAMGSNGAGRTVAGPAKR